MEIGVSMMPVPKQSPTKAPQLRHYCGRCGHRISGPAVLDQKGKISLRYHRECYDKRQVEEREDYLNRLGQK